MVFNSAEFFIAINDCKGSVLIKLIVINDINVSTNDTKDTSIGVRVDDETLTILKRLAEEDERPLAAMVRKLMLEALKARGELTED